MEYTVATEKRCPKCLEVKPREAFSKKRAEKDGLQSRCKVCEAAYREENRARRASNDARWYEQNREQAALRHAEWHFRNAERETARKKADYAQNRAKILARHAAHKRANPDKVAADNQARKASKLKAIPGWADHGAVLDMYRQAKIFSGVLGVDLHVDHVVPLNSRVVCGLHCPDNLQLLAADVNISKGNHYWPDMPDETGVSARPY